jgi:hypothetical protein
MTTLGQRRNAQALVEAMERLAPSADVANKNMRLEEAVANVLTRVAQMYRGQFLTAAWRRCERCGESSEMCEACRYNLPSQEDIDDLFVVVAAAKAYLNSRQEAALP